MSDLAWVSIFLLSDPLHSIPYAAVDRAAHPRIEQRRECRRGTSRDRCGNVARVEQVLSSI